MSVRFAFKSIAFAVMAVLIMHPASAQDETTDIGSVTCKDIMILSGDDRATSISYLLGYVQGANGNTTVDVAALAEISEQFLNGCLDAPTAGALETLQAIMAE